MDRDVIKALIEALAGSDLAELEYRSNGETLRLVKRGGTAADAQAAPPPSRALPAPLAPAASPSPPASPSGPASRDAGAEVVVAPLYGIVHLQQTPDAPPLVSVGQAVSAGQVLCVIEAMKVFNQVRAERDCVIAAVLVQSGREVEAGEPLFRLG